MSNPYRSYTVSELNRMIRASFDVWAQITGYEGEHAVLFTRMGAHDRMQARVTVGGQTFWRNIVTGSLRVEEKEAKVA
jgi:hypothetical protein